MHSLIFFLLLSVTQPGLPQSPHAPAAHLSLPSDERIDINHATADQLVKTTGIARIWAERIVRFRPYRGKNELIEQGILPGEVYNRIRDAIVAHRDPK